MATLTFTGRDRYTTLRGTTPFHGLRFNLAGRYTGMPAQETLNPSAQVPSFSVVERYRYLWVWLDDPTLADPAVIPEMGQLDSKNMRDRFPGFSGRVDRWQIIHYTYPSTICIDVGVAEAGTGAFEGTAPAGSTVTS